MDCMELYGSRLKLFSPETKPVISKIQDNEDSDSPILNAPIGFFGQF